MHCLPEIAIHTQKYMDNTQQLNSHTVSKTIRVKHNCSFILLGKKVQLSSIHSFLGSWGFIWHFSRTLGFRLFAPLDHYFQGFNPA